MAVRVLALPCDRGGCGNLRVRVPLEMLKLDPDVDTHVLDNQTDSEKDVFQAIHMADVLIVRQGGDIGIPALKDAVSRMQKARGLTQYFPKIVLDIDDNIEMISPYSSHYDEYGLEEFSHNGKAIWKDGERGFDLERNRNRINSVLSFMKEADMVSVTTEKLAEYARQYNPNVAVLPNAIDMKKWWKLDTKPHKQLRVIWSGGSSHYEDWYSIKEPLNKLLREFQFKLISAGAHFEGVIDEDNRHLVEVLPWVPFEAHSYRMMCLEGDIAIIPLADLPFNHYKSAIKWVEMSSMGVPSVVANVTPYKEVIKHGFTALSYENDDTFYKSMKELLTNAKLRETIGKNARQRALSHHNAEKNALIWKEAYMSLIDKDS